MADIKDHDVVRDKDLVGDKANMDHEEAIHLTELTEEERVIEKKLRRKIDSLIMPLVVLVYLMNYIDRNNYAAARLQGLEKDLGLTPQQYQTGLSILFVGYILGQVPSNLLLNHLGRPSLYLGFFIIAWGLVSSLTCLVTSYAGIVVCRFILGIVEAPFFAGVLFYLSKWYTKGELNLRMSIFYSGSLISGAFGNLIAAGILSGLAGRDGLDAWQWLYIVEGTITVGIGIIILFVLPDFPHTWKRLSEAERHVANRRMAVEAAEADIDVGGGMSQLTGFKLAMKDPKTHILTLAYMMITGAAGFQNFFPTLTRTLGYSNTVSLLLCAPPYLFITFWALAHSFASDKLGTRFWFFMYPIPVSIVGFLIFMFTDSFGPRYFSLFLMCFVFAMNGTTYAWIASAIPRPPAKRAAAFAFINALGNSASIWTPYVYRDQDKPHYRPALGMNIGLMAIAGACGLTMYVLLNRANKRLARMQDEDTPLGPKDMARLQKSAEMEGVDVATARKMQKNYRYMI